jgi:hypothetical protein
VPILLFIRFSSLAEQRITPDMFAISEFIDRCSVLFFINKSENKGEDRKEIEARDKVG